MTESLDKQTERVVRQGVLANVSSLVATLVTGSNGHVPGYLGELRHLAEQAYELAAPVLDYEAAAFEAGWDGPHTDKFGVTYFENQAEGATWACPDWEALCQDFGIDPYDREVYEHWIVTQDLADDLIAVGEKVDTDFADMCVWARTVTGQNISADACIKAVAELRERRYREAMGEG